MFEVGFREGGERSWDDSCAEARERMAPVQAAVEELESEVALACGVLNAATGRLVALITKMLAMEGDATGGTLSAEQWVTWKCGTSPAHSRALVAMARRLGELPVTRAALEAGELSGDQAGVIARHAPAHIDDQAVELAKLTSVAQLRRSLSRYSFEPKPEPEPDPDEPTPEPEDLTRVSFGHDDDGWWRLSATLGADQGALVEAALSAARRSLNNDPDDESVIIGSGEAGDIRPTWADSFVSMADRSLGSAATNRANDDRTLVMLHLNTNDETGTSAHVHSGPVLPDSLQRYLGCDAKVKPVITFKGTPLSVGRSQRIVPHRTRALVEERDGGCRVPGCDRTRWLHIHHIKHWEDGGATDTSNLVAVCQPHHRMHHLAKLGIRGDGDDPDGVIFTDSWGRVLDPCGRPTLPPQDQPLPAPSGSWVHAPGEPISYRDIWFDESKAAVAAS